MSGYGCDGPDPKDPWYLNPLTWIIAAILFMPAAAVFHHFVWGP